MVVIDKQVIWLQVPVTIRPATEDDLLKLEWFGAYTCYRKLFQETYRDFMMGRQIMWVADVGDFPVGQIFVNLASGLGIRHRAPHGYLYALRVMEPFRRRGLGTALVEAAEHNLVEQGFARATIAVGKTNTGAMRLYKRLGYDIIDDDPGRWQFEDHTGKIHYVEEACWIMEKWLTLSR
ncbi:MAG: GNAT family N-acetyltransferase [Anaerolineae bacterium]|nr:GNAT family N-acetyltransferase [Anaerolineae bacterium]